MSESEDNERLRKENAELVEALRTMVTVYVGAIQDGPYHEITKKRVLQEPAVRRARVLLGLEQE